MTDPGFAAAKVNLTLHVTGQRQDGYHLLDSLVVFADVGDRVTAEPAGDLSLAITGPEAGGLQADASNLVLRAAAAFGSAKGAQLTLHKHLPLASGIGGGSADAAAALRVLAALWAQPLPDAAAVLALGADVPVCLAGRTCRMSGVGEVLATVPPVPTVWAVLVNPRVEVPTPAVFKALGRKENPLMPAIPAWQDAAALAAWLGTQRNDLQAPAMALAPRIGDVLAALGGQPGALIARMSGSGATCFALFATETEASAAAQALRVVNPRWWVAKARLGAAG